MAGSKGRGRGWAAPRAQTPQAEELARFLRNLVDLHGFTLRALEKAMPYGKSTISSNLDGRVPPESFVIDLVKAVVKEPRKQEIDLARARQLWRDADKPIAPPAGAPVPAGGAIALAHKTHDELVSVYSHTMELERERAGAHQLVLLLLGLVGRLQNEVTQLQAVPNTQERLAVLEEQLRTATLELERARDARQEAELLAARAQQQTVSLQEELAQLRAAMPQSGIALAFKVTPEDLPQEFQEEFFLADVDRALRTAQGFLEEGAQRRGHLVDDLGSDAAGPLEARQVGEGWLIVALLLGRLLGCVLMMAGAVLYYTVKTWVTASSNWLGFPDLLVMFGIVLLVDPWDIAWNTVRPWVLRIFTDQREPVVWDLTVREVLVRVLRVPWARPQRPLPC